MGKDLVIYSGGLEVVNEMLQLCREGERQFWLYIDTIATSRPNNAPT